jgi:hypothetical protein
VERELVGGDAREQQHPVVGSVGHPEDHRRQRRLLLTGRAVARDDVVHVVGDEERREIGVAPGELQPLAPVELDVLPTERALREVVEHLEASGELGVGLVEHLQVPLEQ